MSLTKYDLDRMNELHSKIEELKNAILRLNYLITKLQSSVERHDSYFTESSKTVLLVRKQIKLVKNNIFVANYKMRKYNEKTPEWYNKEHGEIEYINEFLIDLDLEDLYTLVELKEKKLELLREQFKNYKIL